MESFTVAEKDRVLCRVAESKQQSIEVCMGTKTEKADVDAPIIQHLIDLGVFKKDSSSGFGSGMKISLTAKGSELYAKGGYNGERKKGYC